MTPLVHHCYCPFSLLIYLMRTKMDRKRGNTKVELTKSETFRLNKNTVKYPNKLIKQLEEI